VVAVAVLAVLAVRLVQLVVMLVTGLHLQLLGHLSTMLEVVLAQVMVEMVLLVLKVELRLHLLVRQILALVEVEHLQPLA
jgi:hypothetical protein